MSDAFTYIGSRVSGMDERDKVLSNVIYAEDFTMPGMIYGKVFRSTRPSAMIKKLDLSKARALKGVFTIMTHEDVPNNESVKNCAGQNTEVGLLEATDTVLAIDRVRYYGEPIALVAAADADVLRDAIELIEIEYEDIPGVYDPEEAMKPDSPKIHGDNNVIAAWKLRKGDVDEAFSKADVIVDGVYSTPRQEHAHLEPEAGVAWTDDMGVLNIRYSTQVIEHYRDIAAILGVPESRVRVIGTILGGGFGGKEDMTVEPYLALLAWKTKKPVKMAYTREEMGFARAKRCPYVFRYKTGASKDGKLVAMEATLIQDSGARVQLSPWILMYSTIHSTGPYEIPNVKVDGYSALTNNVPTSAFRGFGAMQVAWGYESQMDKLAAALGMDPLEFRNLNYYKKGSITGNFQEITSEVLLPEAVTKVKQALGEKTKSSSDTRKVGQGIACGWMSYGRMTYLHDIASVWTGLEMDGSAVVRCGIPDLGGGQRETIRAITAEVLGLRLDEVHVISTDSQSTPIAGTVTATRACYMTGNASKLAAEEVRNVILEQAAILMDLPKETLAIKDKIVYSSEKKADSPNFLPLVKVIQECARLGIQIQKLSTFKAPFTDAITDSLITDPVFADFTFGTQAIEVEVDTETGKVEVLKHVSAYDIGQAINLKRVEGQIEGASVQGLGFAMCEDYREVNGIPITWNLSDYIIPTSMDVADVKTLLLESKSGKGPFGAKGVGEPSIVAAGPAFAAAVRDAVGIEISKLPVTPEEIYWKLHPENA
jgi:CO/xanthine dehydrogenase Mo-binding subunit